ncbi:GDSL esterase/lipase [Camellia lanceoleosa]|uniref:GDSL esterase/lipase n=1 Tax=Camellia lanceoleosa TaxID=1840588 RepID=A0ACC0H342_9ERIC|nr:GDSL esterase/lipase [Camellia lanceoleosa]
MGLKVSTMTFLFLFFLLLFGFNFSEAQKVPGMYVFGDSLVDVGNNNHLKLSFNKADFPHNGIDFPGKIPTGRFSNGYNFADLLAEKVGIVTPPPYLSLVSNKPSNAAFPSTGVSFASGGSGIFNSTDFKRSIPLSKQVEYYSTIVYEDLVHQLGSSGAQLHLSKSIFTFVVGSNELLGYFSSGSDLPNKSTPQQYVDLMVLTLKQVLKSIHNFGARKYVITGIGAVGCCPSQRNQNKTEECNEEANYWTVKYNEGLKSMLQGLKSELKDIDYSILDIYGVFVRFIQTPSTFGFNEVKSACCGLGNLRAQVPCLPISSYCSNRSDHIFWDLYHPTEAATRIFVDTIFHGSQQYTVPMSVEQLIAIGGQEGSIAPVTINDGPLGGQAGAMAPSMISKTFAIILVLIIITSKW